ncbi:MAG: NUDIX hydrolase [Kiritimatiellae bacterium]|jgi:ADP-ribose pyrophosphatase|nr:NUDIX hydrolase [Kiritimatiellia bacterium]
MKFNETTLSSEVILQGIIFRVDRLGVRLNDGSTSTRDILRHAGGVGVLARSPSGTFLLVRQFRKAMESEILEIVAGMREPGESAEESARRELAEETGYQATTMHHLGRCFASPGYTDEVVELYFADTTPLPGDLQLDHDERVTVEEVSQEELDRRIRENEIPDSKTIAAWFFAQSKGLL